MLQSDFDKLGVYKVFAMRVEIELPRNMQVEISSNIASVQASEKFENLLVQTKSGTCHLSKFADNALIRTYSGDILVESEDILVDAHSRHGKVTIPVQKKKNRLELISINGNITVRKAQ